jgi:hypothetical protein
MNHAELCDKRRWKLGFGSVVLARNRPGAFLLLNPLPEDNDNKLEAATTLRDLLWRREPSMRSFAHDHQLPGGRAEARHLRAAHFNPFLVAAMTAAAELFEEADLSTKWGEFVQYGRPRLVLQQRDKITFLFVVSTLYLNLSLQAEEAIVQNGRGTMIDPFEWQALRPSYPVRPRDEPIIRDYVARYTQTDF